MKLSHSKINSGYNIIDKIDTSIISNKNLFILFNFKNSSIIEIDVKQESPTHKELKIEDVFL